MKRRRHIWGGQWLWRSPWPLRRRALHGRSSKARRSVPHGRQPSPAGRRSSIRRRGICRPRRGGAGRTRPRTESTSRSTSLRVTRRPTGLPSIGLTSSLGLPHGKELSAVKVYIAPLTEVAEMCFTTEALGCYGGQTLVVVGESTDGIAPSSIATHEYGHHIAANRSNAPWPAIDWGTKRWASMMGICSRVAREWRFPATRARTTP